MKAISQIPSRVAEPGPHLARVVEADKPGTPSRIVKSADRLAIDTPYPGRGAARIEPHRKIERITRHSGVNI